MEEPHKGCHLVSSTEATSIPFAPILRDATHVRAFGLDVKLNDHNALLQIDTGASGLVLSRSVAEHAGLKQFTRNETGGIGSKGQRSAYTAFADDIKIGALEFRDCTVEVIDQRNVIDMDGLIGADVFSHFLVTLDYPMRKLDLAPLPKRPDDTGIAKPALETANNRADTGEAPADTSGDKQEKAPAAAVSPHGPYNRYIAPEMKDWTRVYRIGHNLLVPASLNHIEQKIFILDTGAFATSISPEVAREVTKVYTDYRTQVKGLSGNVDKVFSADTITFQFANLSQQVNDVVSFSTTSLSKSMGMDIAGLIGITCLGQLKLEIDYRDGLMRFTYDPHRGYRF